ncbi:hypothetical protein [Staphylococcus capitis]|uniref:hypothetical protein n=1 Tax=Staphylococcus capitis TaxID=29388 RepID=UPI001300ACF3|nr:hypothetical protein [Staphylococcus capitis]
MSAIIIGIFGIIPDTSDTNENAITKCQQDVINEQRGVIDDYKEQSKMLKNKNNNEKKR